MNLRPISKADFAAVLALNEESVQYTSPLEVAQFERLWRQAQWHRVAERNGVVLGFVLALGPGADYDSINYQWFAARYPRFLYIDRVVVSQAARGQGVGQALYRDVFAHAGQSVSQRDAGDADFPVASHADGNAAGDMGGVVACEFDVEPPNPVSARFHAAFGFTEVGRQRVAGGSKTVSLQISPLTPIT